MSNLFNQAIQEGRMILTLQDKNGEELKFGDIVAISDGRDLRFYCEVTYLEGEEAIAPFHTFSFHSVEKVEELPDGVVQGKEDRYRMWYHPDPKKDTEPAEEYLASWRACERNFQRAFKIQIISK